MSQYVYENDEASVYVYHDTDDTSLPIQVDTEQEGWLSREDALAVAEAIQGALAARPASIEVSDPRAAWNEAVFTLAAQFGRLVIFDYQKEASSNIERRKLRPSYVVNGVATGVDLAREEIRAFRLDRVQGWAKVG